VAGKATVEGLSNVWRRGLAPSPYEIRLSAGSCRSGAFLHNWNCGDFNRLDWLVIIVIQQFRTILDGGSAPFTEDNMAIAFRVVDRYAAVLAHPTLELTGRVFYH
jgi:hypothetical protein